MLYALVVFLFLGGQHVNTGVAGPFQTKEQCEAKFERELALIKEANSEYFVTHTCATIDGPGMQST